VNSQRQEEGSFQWEPIKLVRLGELKKFIWFPPATKMLTLSNVILKNGKRIVLLSLMWKKLTIIFVFMIYALASTGAIVNLDYCCGKLLSISLVPVEQKKDKCDKDALKGKSCCDSKQVHLNVNGEQELVQKSLSLSSNACAILPLNDVHFIFEAYQKIHTCSDLPPPLYSSSPLFLQHSVFRI